MEFVKGRPSGGFAFFSGARAVAFTTAGKVGTVKWAHRGNRLTISGNSTKLTYVLSFTSVSRTIGGRKIRLQLVRLRNAQGKVSTMVRGRLGQNGRIKGLYCTYIGFAETVYGRFSSMSTTIRYRFDGRGRVRSAVRRFVMSNNHSPRGSNLTGYANRNGGIGQYFVWGGEAFIVWPDGTGIVAKLPGRSGRATSLTIDGRPYGPSLCN